jgi:hypothetical protein
MEVRQEAVYAIQPDFLLSYSVFADHQASVLTTQAEGIGESRVNIFLQCFVGDVVQVALRVGILVINCGWDDIILNS